MIAIEREMKLLLLSAFNWPKYANLEKIFYLNFEIFLQEKDKIKEKNIREKNKLFFEELPLY